MSVDREVAICRCPRCGVTFRVLADEMGMHGCPRCSYGDEPETEDESNEDEDE